MSRPGRLACRQERSTTSLPQRNRTAGLGGSLNQAHTDSGYDVLEPTNSADGAIVEESIVYTRADLSDMMTPSAVMNAVPISRLESLSGQPTPAVTRDVIDNADIIIVIGTDLTSAPWQESDRPLFEPGIGRLLIIDATTNASDQRSADEQAQALRAAGIDIAGIVTAVAHVEETMLMPIGQSTPWAFAIAELAGIVDSTPGTQVSSPTRSPTESPPHSSSAITTESESLQTAAAPATESGAPSTCAQVDIKPAGVSKSAR